MNWFISSFVSKQVLFFTISGLLLMGTLGAQGKGPAGNQTASGLNNPVVKQTFDVSGKVASVELGLGQGSPSMTLNSSGTIYKLVLAPYPYLSDQGFELGVGDHVEAVIFQSLVYPGLYIATQVLNLTKGVSVTLRDEDGAPLWRHAGGGRKFQRGTQKMQNCDGTRPNLEAAVSLSGVVTSIGAELGKQNPSITLDSGETILVGPYRAWIESSFDLQVGHNVVVFAFPSSATPDLWVAFTIENLDTFQTLVLRDDTGIPIKGKRRSSKGSTCQGDCRSDR